MKRVFSWLSRVLEVSNVQELTFIGTLPAESLLERHLRLLGGYVLLDGSVSLRDLLQPARPRAIITFIGIGTSSGFFINGYGSNSKALLPVTWWRTDGFTIELFAFSCHSMEFLKTSSMMVYLESALGYEGELWLSDDGKFWASFLKRVREALTRLGRLGELAYSAVQREYSRAIDDRALDDGESYLAAICLVRQSERLRFIAGSGV